MLRQRSSFREVFGVGSLVVLLACVSALLVLLAGQYLEGGEPSAKAKLTKADVDAMMKSLSNWGRWGKEDELGTLNLITPAKRKQAAALVQEGVTVSMAHEAIKVEAAGSSPFGHKMTAIPTGLGATSASDEYRVAYHG